MALPFQAEQEQVDLWGNTPENVGRPSLADRFVIPPFTVLNAREGFWQARKRAWIACGIKGETGRDGELTGGSAFSNAWQAKHPECKSGQGVPESGTSIFDPVVCELCYRWFAPPQQTILDPFAGGSVRGIVAALLNRGYIGIDLRPEQVEANEAQWEEIGKGNTAAPNPHWIQGDSRNIPALVPQAVDFVFSCPPYFDLEKYSDNPKDLSAADDYGAFLTAYREIIGHAVNRLRPDRFAAFVVGDIRDKRGNYRNFVSDTIAAFRDAGTDLYNEAILVTSVGSLPIRVGKQFDVSRKLGKTHQNVLVFVKGDARKATEAVGPVADVVGA